MLRAYIDLGAVAILLLAVVACSGRQPAPAATMPVTAAAAPPVDPCGDEVDHLIRALATDAPDAERRFSETMRTELPPEKLAGLWHSLRARDGAFQSFSIAHTDTAYGKRRYAVDVDFAERKVTLLVVFEPDKVEISGFFVVGEAPRKRVPAKTDTAADPDVAEVNLPVGTPLYLLGATLAGPRKRGDQRLPGVVMVGGSGPNDRDETVPGAKPFRDIAVGLARRGIVTLRFDKRTFTYRHLDKPGFTVEDEVIADAVAAAATLRARPEVDPSRFYVLGHSLGAQLAPEIAERCQNVSGLLLLAAPARPMLESLLEQLRLRGAPPSAIAALEKQAKALPSMPPDQRVVGIRAEYWQDLARRDELALARRLDLPTLYLRGDLDHNVFADDQEKWNRVFVGDAHYESITLPGLTHLLTPPPTSEASEVHVPDDVIAKMADFVLEGPLKALPQSQSSEK